ncbi:outer membrane protein assembly factor BamD [Cellulosilyticum ruminicola]|uniref:hypothetical protein n=1 Tax=Cellulosilyticum ruminicola TaxID=425254 RepID=UPI0006D26C4B|nr:hypothetical protein [Cellulosilyticum ruminicola]
MKKRTLILILSTFIALCLIGCSTTKDPNPSETTSSFLQAMQHQDYSSVKTYYAENVDNFPNFKNKVESISPQVANELFSKMSDFTYTVEKAAIDPNDSTKATTTVNFRCYDLGKAFESIILDYLDTDLTMTFNGAKDDEIVREAEDVIVKRIDESKQDFIVSIPISLTLKDNTWKVNKLESNLDLMNALSGNILYTIRKLTNTLNTPTENSSLTTNSTNNSATSSNTSQ